MKDTKLRTIVNRLVILKCWTDTGVWNSILLSRTMLKS